MNFKFKFALTYVALLMSVFALQSCSDDPEPIRPGEDGFFIVNEGGFGNSNTSISFYDQATNSVSNDIFASKNGRPLGDQTQSMSVFEGKGYIMVQNSGKVEVINADDYASVVTIDEGIESPRYFLGISEDKGYVSDWGADGVSGSVKVIDLKTNTVVNSISTGKGANRMIKVGDNAYVTNNGGYDTDNTVKVIDTKSDVVSSTISVGENPNSLVQDAAGNIWVVSAGTFAYNEDYSIDEENSTPGSISKITGNSESIRITIPKISYPGASNLSISPDGKTLYWIFDGAIYSMPTTSTTLPASPLKNKSYYGLAVNPFNGNLVGCLAPNFSSAGSIEIMDPSGSLLSSFATGIAPSGCAFK